MTNIEELEIVESDTEEEVDGFVVRASAKEKFTKQQDGSDEETENDEGENYAENNNNNYEKVHLAKKQKIQHVSAAPENQSNLKQKKIKKSRKKKLLKEKKDPKIKHRYGELEEMDLNLLQDKDKAIVETIIAAEKNKVEWVYLDGTREKIYKIISKDSSIGLETIYKSIDNFYVQSIGPKVWKVDQENYVAILPKFHLALLKKIRDIFWEKIELKEKGQLTGQISLIGSEKPKLSKRLKVISSNTLDEAESTLKLHKVHVETASVAVAIPPAEKKRKKKVSSSELNSEHKRKLDSLLPEQNKVSSFRIDDLLFSSEQPQNNASSLSIENSLSSTDLQSSKKQKKYGPTQQELLKKKRNKKQLDLNKFSAEERLIIKCINAAPENPGIIIGADGEQIEIYKIKILPNNPHHKLTLETIYFWIKSYYDMGVEKKMWIPGDKATADHIVITQAFYISVLKRIRKEKKIVTETPVEGDVSPPTETGDSSFSSNLSIAPPPEQPSQTKRSNIYVLLSPSVEVNTKDDRAKKIISVKNIINDIRQTIQEKGLIEKEVTEKFLHLQTAKHLDSLKIIQKACEQISDQEKNINNMSVKELDDFYNELKIADESLKKIFTEIQAELINALQQKTTANPPKTTSSKHLVPANSKIPFFHQNRPQFTPDPKDISALIEKNQELFAKITELKDGFKAKNQIELACLKEAIKELEDSFKRLQKQASSLPPDNSQYMLDLTNELQNLNRKIVSIIIFLQKKKCIFAMGGLEKKYQGLLSTYNNFTDNKIKHKFQDVTRTNEKVLLQKELPFLEDKLEKYKKEICSLEDKIKQAQGQKHLSADNLLRENQIAIVTLEQLLKENSVLVDLSDELNLGEYRKNLEDLSAEGNKLKNNYNLVEMTNLIQALEKLKTTLSEKTTFLFKKIYVPQLKKLIDDNEKLLNEINLRTGAETEAKILKELGTYDVPTLKNLIKEYENQNLNLNEQLRGKDSIQGFLNLNR